MVSVRKNRTNLQCKSHPGVWVRPSTRYTLPCTPPSPVRPSTRYSVQGSGVTIFYMCIIILLSWTCNCLRSRPYTHLREQAANSIFKYFNRSGTRYYLLGYWMLHIIWKIMRNGFHKIYTSLITIINYQLLSSMWMAQGTIELLKKALMNGISLQ